ncbi:MAG: tyrosine-type recombinase/integrase [Planctomycetaceae bacterium]|nr:tyrosine-type recombinase/integrase [Planctomycetaceae bacterium]
MARSPKPWFRKDRDAWFVTLDGRRHNLGPDREAAFRRFHQMMAEPAKRTVSSDLLVALIDVFLDWLQKHRTLDTFEWYRYRLERLARKYPDMRASELKPFHVQQWVDGYTLSVTSRRNYLRSIKRCLRWAVRQGYLDKSPIAELEVPTAERREIVVSADEYAAILEAVTDRDFYDLLVVTWETGCRPQESLRVEARHLDAFNRRWVFPKSESKNKKLSRVVYMTPTAFEIVERRAAAFPAGPLFRNSNGSPWTTEAVNCAFRRVRTKLGQKRIKDQNLDIHDDDLREFKATLKREKTENGITRPKTEGELCGEARRKLIQRKACSLVPNYSLYALRHSWATHALQRGVDPLTVAILMGHSDPSMLARVYQHLSLNPQHLRSQLEKAVG